MAEAFAKPALRPFLPADTPVLAAIFRESIEDLAAEDYSDAQRAAWAALAEDEAEFRERVANALTLVAKMAGSVVGFASLKGADHVDMLYVHPAAARQGVANQLCDALEKLAAARGAKLLTVDASDTARPFFENRGYEAERRGTLALGGEWLGNTRMHKRLASAAGA